MENYFSRLNGINVNDKTEKKNGLTYLSWAWAWGEVKKLHPDATYTVYENATGWNYHTDGKTCWVKTGVTVEGIEHIEYLPVMDFRNASIPLDKVTSFDVNKAIQRSLTKALARHGLGLYIYAGEDLPEGESEPKTPAELITCEICGCLIKPAKTRSGETWTVENIVGYSKKRFDQVLCPECQTNVAKAEKAAEKAAAAERKAAGAQ